MVIIHTSNEHPDISVATVVTDVFSKKIEFRMPRKLAKTVRIFVEIDHIENHILTRKNQTGISHAMEQS